MSTKLYFVAPWTLGSQLELVFYGKFGFSRTDLDENKPAKGKCLAGKYKEVFYLDRGSQFDR